MAMIIWELSDGVLSIWNAAVSVGIGSLPARGGSGAPVLAGALRLGSVIPPTKTARSNMLIGYRMDNPIAYKMYLV